VYLILTTLSASIAWNFNCTFTYYPKLKKYSCEISANESYSNETINVNVDQVILTKELPCDSMVNFCERFPFLKEIIADDATKLNCLKLNNNSWKNCKDLTGIALPKNKIDRVDDDTFDDALKLEKLILNDNRIEFIGPKAFRNLICLKKLNFENNKLNLLHRDVFINNLRLESLILSKNFISELHPDIFRSLVFLTFLELNNNRLKVLHTDLFLKFLSLNFLYLGNNGISAVEKGCFNRTLNYFYFVGNECADANLGGLSVRKIDQKLKDCYENFQLNSFFTLKLLKCIFGKNQTTKNVECTVLNAEVLTNHNYTFHVSSSEFLANDYNDEEVKVLNLKTSRFDFIPSQFCETFKNLQTLKASKVGIFAKLNFIENCTSLEHLDLSRNEIRILEPGTFLTLIQLKMINLESNKITNLDCSLFSSLSKLVSLNVGDNFITEITENLLKPLKNLQEFLFYQNFLTKIDEIFMKNQELKTVNFEANEILGIHSSAFKNHSKLNHLNFKGNKCINKMYNSSDVHKNLDNILKNCHKVYCIGKYRNAVKLEL
jgi:Leucine-rich repeat (LRR) protein